MAAVLLPDAELLVVEALRDDPDVAAIIGSRVYTALPPNPTFPLARIIRVSGARPWPPRHVDAARIQIDAWADTKRDAWLLIDTLLAAAAALPGTHDEGVVTAVEHAVGPAWTPDAETGTARYVADVVVYSHPRPSSEQS